MTSLFRKWFCKGKGSISEQQQNAWNGHTLLESEEIDAEPNHGYPVLLSCQPGPPTSPQLNISAPIETEEARILINNDTEEDDDALITEEIENIRSAHNDKKLQAAIESFGNTTTEKASIKDPLLDSPLSGVKHLKSRTVTIYEPDYSKTFKQVKKEVRTRPNVNSYMGMGYRPRCFISPFSTNNAK